jgi:type I restriction-modification system DNA methylase subunit/restriction endonuclease S subunit
MFELFLDQGIKQSEGQFFTPMPIVKFIINSLPYKQNPNVIDYACGAGHFLNEYALQKKEEKEEVKIVGVEKEYRLSKVAKVSSFMYGSDIEIIYADALSQNEKIKDDNFDILIANPPYSVKGFLQTLSDEDRKRFELIDEVDTKSYSKTGAIECFFIERAKQLLTKDAVIGIIVPSSILNKDTPKLYTKTREIILQNFDIVAICEFGSGTFGKTGTNTVTLFLRKIDNTINLKQHFVNIIDEWFSEYKISSELKDENLVINYCNYLEYDYDEYFDFFKGKFEYKEPLKIEIFSEYKAIFEKKKKFYKELSNEEKLQIEKEEFIKYVKEKEKEKLLYFALANKQNNDVVIVKSPSKTDKIKKFLGYEWGSRKGSEGIHYLTSSKIDIDEEIDEEDKAVLENLTGLKHINTPLYNPQNKDDKNKINKIIKDNFEGISYDVAESLKEFVTRANLVDMIDFKRNDFNKAINLNPNRKIEIKSRWELVRLGKLVNLLNGFAFKSEDYINKSKTLNFRQANIRPNGILNLEYKKTFLPDEYAVKYKDYLLKDGDIVIAMTDMNKELNLLAIPTIIKTNGYNLLLNQRVGKFYDYSLDKIKPEFLNEILKSKIVREILTSLGYGNVQSNLSKMDLLNIKIPLPPMDIQEKIVKECETVDKEVESAKKENDNLKQKIKNIILSIKGHEVKLENIATIKSGGTPKRDKIEYWHNGTINWIRSEVCQNSYVYENQVKEKITELGLKKSSAFLFPKNTILIALVGATLGKIGYLTFESSTNQNIAGLYYLKNCLPKYLFYTLMNTPKLNNYANGDFKMINLSKIKSIEINLPHLDIQKQIVSKIEELEKQIEKNGKIIEDSKEKKEEILRKYL